MKLKTVIILSLLSLLTFGVKAQQQITIQGQITAEETGLPIAQQAVYIGFWPETPLITEYSNANGSFLAQLEVQPNDSVVSVIVWVKDCNQQTIAQSFPIQNTFQVLANFEICTQTVTCEAAFLGEPIPGNQQLIGFDNLSTPVSYSTFWYWDFGDGTNSYEFEPMHEYAEPGTYNVCLTMVDSMLACTSNFCLEVWVNLLPEDCQAQFSWEAQEFTVSFTDLSLGTPDTWLWDFGDGTTSSEQNPIHSWNAPGTYQVCLSISNDSTLCYDTICESINLVDTQCHAEYSYLQTGNKTLSFTNLSTGMIDQFIWDFGDGSPFSHEFDVEHTWQQAGVYHVCLAVISNYFGCQDVYCENISVGDTISVCHAGFAMTLDSIPGNINHYWFTDTSTGDNISNWYWDFGDGTISFLPSVEHTFAQGGTYTVCHAIGGTGVGGYCTDTICQTITTPSYYNLGGQIFAGNFPINNPEFTGDTALVRLYKKSGTRLSEIAIDNFWEYGYYFFFDVLEGEYVVQADLTPESNAYTAYMPVYSGDVPYWQQAQSFSLSGGDLFDADVVMPSLQMESGPGLISGQVVCADNSPVDLRERIIYLLRDGNIVSLSHTETLGYFTFPGIPLGAYTLRAEIAGKYSEALAVNLTEFSNQAMQLQLMIASSNVYGIDDAESLVKEVKLFPNPARGIINLTFNLDRQANLLTEVYTSTGSVCMNETHFCQSGENKLTLNIASLKPGFYLIALKSAQGAILQTLKFSKM